MERTVVLLQNGDIWEYIVLFFENRGSEPISFGPTVPFYITDSENRFPFASNGVSSRPHKFGSIFGRYVIAVDVDRCVLDPSETRILGAGALRVGRADADAHTIAFDDPCLEFDGESVRVNVIFPYHLGRGWEVTPGAGLVSCTHTAYGEFVPLPERPHHVRVRASRAGRSGNEEVLRLDVQVAMTRIVVAADACGDNIARLAPSWDSDALPVWERALDELRLDATEDVVTRQRRYRAHIQSLLSRRNRIAETINPVQTSDIATVLILTSAPRDATSLDVDVEVRDIQERLQLAKYRDKIRVEVRGAARATALQRYISESNPRVIHFSGHGAEDGGLLFEVGDDREMAFISGEILAEVLAANEARVQVVVLNACYTSVHAEALLEVVDAVVAMTRAVRDDAAVCFSSAFYGALAQGQSVQAAFRQGVVELKLRGIATEADVPRLLVKSGISASDVRLVAGSQ